jgi:hypothetical protein
LDLASKIAYFATAKSLSYKRNRLLNWPYCLDKKTQITLTIEIIVPKRHYYDGFDDVDIETCFASKTSSYLLG